MEFDGQSEIPESGIKEAVMSMYKINKFDILYTEPTQYRCA